MSFVKSFGVEVEVVDLDETIDLFNEDDWSFVVEDSGMENYSYLFDSNEEFSYIPLGNRVKAVLPIVFILSAVCMIGFTVVIKFGVSDFSDYDSVAGVAGEYKQVEITYIDGEDAEIGTIIEASLLISDYMAILESGVGYRSLNNLCIGESIFYETYISYLDGVASSYDSSDCRARMFNKFGTLYTVNRVTRVISKDGIFYCYMDLNIPTYADIAEYVNLYRYSFTKHFASGDISEDEVVKYLLELMKVNTFTCSPGEFCIELGYVDGILRIKDDTLFKNICVEAYNTSVIHITTLLSGSIIGK